jgi:hypothetical protein
VKKYLTRLTVTPTGSTVSFGTDKPKSPAPKLYQWSYQFSNGSRLWGEVTGQLGADTKTILNPTNISADYVAQDSKTVLQHWVSEDFACFESTLNGTDLLIVASNDNFVGNSMCLVESPQRKRAQVSDSGISIIGETLHQEAWSIKEKIAPVSLPTWEIDWQVAPLFPFIAVNLNFRLPNTKTSYHWALFPWFCPLPYVRVSA